MLTLAGKDAALLRVFAGQCFVGIRGGKQEPTWLTYQRQHVSFGTPGGAGTAKDERHVANANEVRFLCQEALRVDGWLIADGFDEVLAEGALDAPLDMGPDQEVIFRPGEITVAIR